MGNTDEYFSILYNYLEENNLEKIEEYMLKSFYYIDLISTGSASGILIQRGIEYATDENDDMIFDNIVKDKELFRKFSSCI